MKNSQMHHFDLSKRLTREEMRNILGGVTSGVSMTCYCSCNSGLGVQPSFTTTVSNYDPAAIYTPGASNCDCAPLYYAAQPGYNGGSCSRNFDA